MKSTLHANCGCQWQSREINPADVLTDAVRHVAATGHTVDLGGLLKPSTSAYRAPLSRVIPPMREQAVGEAVASPA